MKKKLLSSVATLVIASLPTVSANSFEFNGTLSKWGTDAAGSGGNAYSYSNNYLLWSTQTDVTPNAQRAWVAASPSNGSNGVFAFGLANNNVLASQAVSSFALQSTDLPVGTYTKLVFDVQNSESFLYGSASGNLMSMSRDANRVTLVLKVIDPVASASDPTGNILQATGGVALFSSKTNANADSGITSQGGTVFYTNFYGPDVTAPLVNNSSEVALRANGVNGVQGTFGAYIPTTQLDALGLDPLSITGSRDGQAPAGFVFTQDGSSNYSVNGAQVTFYNFVLKNSSWSNRDVQFGQGNGDSVVTGVVSDQGSYTSFTKTGTGAVTLSAVNTYTGGTNINGGNLIVSSDNNLGAASGAIAFNGGALKTDSGITSARAISIAAGGAELNTNGSNSTLSGTISGVGIFTKSGLGSLTLSGSNNYTGGTTVSAGSLIGSSSSLQGAITNNSAVNFNQSTDGTYSGDMGGSGVLTKSGSGKLIMTGTNNYTGNTYVDGGILAINGSVSSNVAVASGAQLQGSGSFGGATINGILAPGNSIGTITSNGNLTFASGSTYNVEVDAAGNSDKTIVNGVATIQGGNVAVSGTTSSPSALPRTKYTILTATNGVSGRFSGFTGLTSYSFLTPTLYYGSNDVSIGWDLTPFSTVAKNINQRNVGNALTIAALGPVNSLGAPILNALFSGNYENAQAVMDTVGGSGLAGVQSTAMQVGEMASSSVSDQIAFWRSGETMDATGRTSQEGNNPRNFLAYAPTEKNVAKKGPINLKGPAGSLTAAVAPRTFRAWGSMFGGGANYLSDAGRGAAASNIGYYGGLIGVDYQVQPNILVGVALGGSYSNFNVGSLSTNGNLTGFHAGVYGAYTMGNSYIALNETFSAYSNQTTRKAGGYAYMPYEQLSASFGSTEFRTRAEVGHGVLMGGLKATPFVAAEIAAYQSNAFSEQSSIYASTFALRNNGQGVNSLPTFAGLRLSNAVTLSNGWRLAPVGSVAYVHEFFPQRQFNNILMSMPGADFNVAGPRSTYNLVQTKVGAQLNLNEKLALFTDFQGEFSPVSQSYGGKGGVKYVW